MLNLIQHLPRTAYVVIKQIVIPEGRCRGSPFCLFPALTPAQALTYETDVGDSPQKPWGMTLYYKLQQPTWKTLNQVQGDSLLSKVLFPRLPSAGFGNSHRLAF